MLRLTFFALTVSAVLVQPAAAVVGASSRDEALARHTVMVLKRAPGSAGFCSGVVLEPRIVLTAGHCVTRPGDTRIHFRRADGAPVLVPVARVSVHPQYRADAIQARARSIDLALVETAADLPFQPMGVAAIANSEPEGTFVRIGGYGMRIEGDAASSGEFRAARLVVRGPVSSVLLWLRDPQGAGTGACTGDSGGPAVDGQGRLVAITSWSAGEAGRRCGALTQAVLLAPHRGWIMRVLESWR